jgi:predicted  nucleic acid-binding Zn-ribbon protein
MNQIKEKTMKRITKLVEKELKKINSKIQKVKQSSKIAFDNGEYNAWGQYDKIFDKLNYRRICLEYELDQLNRIQEGK